MELESVLHHLPVAVAVATDASGHRARGNPAFARLVGLPVRPGTSAAPFAPGTSFELFFPVAPDSRRDRTDPAMPTPPLRRGTVLVVDDEPAVRALATATLSAAGYAAATAAAGEEAVALLRQDPLRFDSVVLDLSMPRLAGEDTLMALRMLAPELPVVVTSGHTEQFVAERFLGRGIASFLPKPFVSAALLRTVAAAIARPPAH